MNWGLNQLVDFFHRTTNVQKWVHDRSNQSESISWMWGFEREILGQQNPHVTKRNSLIIKQTIIKKDKRWGGKLYYFNIVWTNDQPTVSEVGIFLLSQNHAVLIFCLMQPPNQHQCSCHIFTTMQQNFKIESN